MDIDRTQFSETWQKRFAYFDRYGPMSTTPEGRRAFRMLPFLDRMRLGGNLFAFLFGPIYFFVKGMWRKGLSLLGLACVIAVSLFVFDVGSAIERMVGLVVPVLAMVTANYGYYLHVVEHNRSWNPLEGMKAREPR
jgi:hypothetical protein